MEADSIEEIAALIAEADRDGYSPYGDGTAERHVRTLLAEVLRLRSEAAREENR